MHVRHLQVRDMQPGEKFILGREVMRPITYELIDHDRGRFPGTSLCRVVETGQIISFHKTSFTIRSN